MYSSQCMLSQRIAAVHPLGSYLIRVWNFMRLPLVNILGLSGRRSRLFILVNNRSFGHFAVLDHFEVSIMHSFIFLRAQLGANLTIYELVIYAALLAQFHDQLLIRP